MRQTGLECCIHFIWCIWHSQGWERTTFCRKNKTGQRIAKRNANRRTTNEYETPEHNYPPEVAGGRCHTSQRDFMAQGPGSQEVMRNGKRGQMKLRERLEPGTQIPGEHQPERGGHERTVPGYQVGTRLKAPKLMV